MGLFEVVKDRTNVCPNCYKAIKQYTSLGEYAKMIEKYDEELLEWDKATNTGTIKVVRKQQHTLEQTGANNVHESASVFPKTTEEMLLHGLSDMMKTKERLKNQLDTNQEQLTNKQKLLESNKMFTKWNEELRKISHMLQNIQILNEIDKLEEANKEVKENIKDNDSKITVRNVLLGKIRDYGN